MDAEAPNKRGKDPMALLRETEDYAEITVIRKGEIWDIPDVGKFKVETVGNKYVKLRRLKR